MKIKITRTHHNKIKSMDTWTHGHKQTYKQTTQDNTRQQISAHTPPQEQVLSPDVWAY